MRTKKMAAIRLVSVLSAATFVFVSPGLSASAAYSSSSSLIDILSGTEGTGYYDYARKNSSAAAGNEEIPLPLSGATLSEAGTSSDEISGKPAIRIKDGGSAAWTVNVPADGRYTVQISYALPSGRTVNPELAFTLDGQEPFDGSIAILCRQWKDKTEIQQDRMGNDLIPQQEEVIALKSVLLTGTGAYQSAPYELLLTAGAHTLELSAPEDPVIISEAALIPPPSLSTYAEKLAEYRSKGYEPVDDVLLEYQAESTSLKSHRVLYPVSDRGNAATVPSDPAVTKRNIIGQSNWSDAGMWVSYKANVKKAGLYALSFKYRQNIQLGMSTYRRVYINDEVPYEEMDAVAFSFKFKWSNLTVADSEGRPYYVYLKEGDNTITLEATVGPWSSVLSSVENTLSDLNTLYRRIIMVTSTNPDTYRDYMLEAEVEGLTEVLDTLANRLLNIADEFDTINGSHSVQSETLRRAGEQLAQFRDDPDSIPRRLSRFNDNISMLSQWVMDNVAQPIELDYFMLHDAEHSLPKANGGFFKNLLFGILRFLAAFSDDYGSMSDWEDGEGGTTITVWTSEGRDQAQILRDRILYDFTKETSIQVNLNLVLTGFVEATLSGRGPDVAVGVARGQPVNLAARGALISLDEFTGFEDVKSRFTSDALVPYTLDGKCYGLPMTQTWLMMFVRDDIMEELGLSVPETWDEVADVVAVLQRNNMGMGLPYASVTAQNAIDMGVGAKDMFPALLMQSGGSFYNDDLTSTALDSQEALGAFKKWTDFYTKYSFSLSFDFNSRFRTGELPLVISAYTMYGLLSAAAPEIRGRWSMTQIPGMLMDNGEINRTSGASGAAAVIFDKATGKKDACWQFMDWLTSADTQTDLGNETESLLGTAARSATANVEAMARLAWSSEERAVLNEQRISVKEVPEIPGSYYMARGMDNAFRDVLYNYANPRIALEKENTAINRELYRKREELLKKK